MSNSFQEFFKQENITPAKVKPKQKCKVHLLVILEGATEQYFRHWWHGGKKIDVEKALGYLKDNRKVGYYMADKLQHLTAVDLFDQYCVDNDYNFPVPDREIFFATDIPVETRDIVLIFKMSQDGEMLELRECTHASTTMLPLSWEPNTEYIAMTC